MSPSQEHDDAVGAAPTAQEQLDVKRSELQQATAALEQAELAYDVPRAVQLQNEVEVLRRFVEKLTAAAAVEAAGEAKVEAGELHQRLRARYAKALEALAPELDSARAAIEAAVATAMRCTKTWATASKAWYEIRMVEWRFALD